MKQTRREFVRTLFIASQATLIGGLSTSRLLAESSPVAAPGGLNFLVFGDWGRKGERDQTEVAGQMAKTARETHAQFIVSVGDNFYEDGVTSVDDQHWRASFEDVYHEASLQVPWQVILGNHDYQGDCDAQIAYGKTSPRWRMPARYYAVSHPVDAATTADFFYLDTTPMLKEYYEKPKTRHSVRTQDVPKQRAWFKAALAASKAQWKIVIGHHPIYSGGGHGDSPELIENILPLLHEHKVPVWFNGHDHDLEHLADDGVNFFDSGAGSQVWPTHKTERTKFAKSCPGFTAVSLQADRMDVRMIDSFGKLLYRTSVPRVPA